MESSGTYTLHELVAPSKLLLEPPFTVGGVVGKIFIHLVVELKKRKLFEYTLVTEEGSTRLSNLMQSVNDLCATDLTETGMISSRRYRHSSKQEVGIVVIEVKNCNSLNLVIVVLFLNAVPTVLLYSVGTKFSNNTRIEYFDEFKYFTGYSGNMTSGGAGIFQGCTALKYLTVPNSVTQLVNFAFRAMGSTVRIDLPNTISYMEYRYTWDIKNTTILICRAVTPPRFSSTSSNAYLARWNPIYVPDDSVATYKAASVWSNYASKIKALSEYTGR